MTAWAYNTFPTMTEYEIAKIAIEILKIAIDKNLTIGLESATYDGCVKAVKNAHGIKPDTTLQELMRKNE